MGVLHEPEGKFDLVLALLYDPDAPGILVGQLARWKQSFERASELLFAATDGQHQLGSIYVCPYGTGTLCADAWLMLGAGPSTANGRIWLPGTHMELMYDEQFRPFVILHELGHYLYGLGDEFKNTAGLKKDAGGNPVACLGRDPVTLKLPGACIMEGGYMDGDRFGAGGNGGGLVPGDVTDFCVACNHDLGGVTTCADGLPSTNHDHAAADTVQSTRHGKSCWETMVDFYPGLALPGTSPDPGPTSGADPIDWKELVAEQRFVLLADRSSAFASACPEGWLAMKEALNDWVDLAPPRDRAALGAFDHACLASWPGLPEIDSRRGAARAFVDRLAPGGGTNLHAALRYALETLRGAGPQATTQIVVVFSGSRQDAGQEPLGLIPEFRRAGIRICAVAFGPEADEGRLEALCAGTGGRVGGARLFAGRRRRGESVEVRSAVARFLATTHDGGGVITADATVPIAWDPTLPGLPGAGDTEFDVPVEEACEAVTFAAFWDGGADARFELRSPSGRRITPLTTHGDVRHGSAGRPFAFYELLHPEPGRWRPRLAVGRPGAVREGDTVVHIAMARSRHVHLAATSPRARYSLGEKVPVAAQVAAPRLLAGLPVTATVTAPDGVEKPVALEVAPEGNLFEGGFEPRAAGVYSVTVVADNRKGTAGYVEGVDVAAVRRRRSRKPRARFLRRLSLTVVVGARPSTRPGAHPDRLGQGTRTVLRLTLGGHAWTPGSSTFHLGPGIRAVEMLDRPPEDHAATFVVEVERKAASGPRDGIVRTGDARYVLPGLIHVEGDPPRPVDASPERRTRPGRFLLRRRG